VALLYLRQLQLHHQNAICVYWVVQGTLRMVQEIRMSGMQIESTSGFAALKLTASIFTIAALAALLNTADCHKQE
jgi:hypothetical protein